MRKYLCFFLTFLLLFCLSAVPANAAISDTTSPSDTLNRETGYVDADTKSTNNSNDGNDNKYVIFVFDDRAASDTDYQVKVGLYSHTGALLYLTTLDQTVSKGDPFIFLDASDYLTGTGQTLKAFLYENGTFVPYAAPIIKGNSNVTLDTPTIVSSTITDASAEIVWANKYTVCIKWSGYAAGANPTAQITAHVPDSWEYGATWSQDLTGGSCYSGKATNNKQYVTLSVSGESGTVILQKKHTEESVYSLEQPTFADFYENKRGAVSVTFDDGDYTSAEIYNTYFKEYDLHGTAFLIPGRITENSTAHTNWKTLLSAGYVDVGNHSMNHSLKYSSQASELTSEQLTTDISDSYKKLHQLFPDQKILTFASPWGQTTTDSIEEMKTYHYANRLAGGGLQNKNPSGDDWFKLRAFVFNESSLSDMKGWADQALNNGGWAIELFHDCTAGSSSTYTVNKTLFKDHLAYLNSKKDDLWIGSFNEVTAYIKERQNARVTVDFANEKTVKLTVKDTLPDDRFSQPLTLLVQVPDSWKNGATYFQGTLLSGESIVVQTKDSKNYVQINAVPDGGQVVLQKK